MRNTPPVLDQIELTLFGPGYGECVVVHLGEDRWIIVDSCLNIASGESAVLEYFKAIGVSAEKAVRLIVISHWHDDHVRGLSNIVASCPKAPVCLSSALTKNEFLSFALDYKDIMSPLSGVREINQTFQMLKGRPKIEAIANRRVFSLPAEGYADPCIITTLSPSDKEYDTFLRGLGALITPAGQTKKRAPSLTPNNASVALWIEVGDVRILLGSDLEEKGEPSSGWSAIVQSAERPQGHATVFKIPHHGSSSGHHDRVWSDMVVKSPLAVLSPFYLAGTRLPTRKDVSRIVKLAPASYITSRHPPLRSRRRRPAPVERAIREVVTKMRIAQPPMGWVSLRNAGKSKPDIWNVELSDASSRLDAMNA